MAKETVNGVTGVMLTKYENECRVYVEVDGKWYCVIVDNQECISHIAEAAGINTKVKNGPSAW